MSAFFEALLADDVVFVRYAVLAALLASIPAGVIGTYVVVRRISYIAGSIAHCVLGGLGAARYCQIVYGWEWLDPMYGAVATAMLAALIIGMVSLRAKEREDTVIGALWAIGMAVGVLFIYRTPGYNQDILEYLFGDILFVGAQDLWLIGLLDVAVVGLGVAFYHRFLAICFDEEFARLRGIRVESLYLLLLGLTALTVVLLVKVVGIVLVIALLTLPAAIAGQLTRSLWQMMVVAWVLTIVFMLGGLMVSFPLDLPTGATIIVLAGAVYLLVTGGQAVRNLLRARA